MSQPLSDAEFKIFHGKIFAYFYPYVDNRADVEDLTSSTLVDYYTYEKKWKTPLP